MGDEKRLKPPHFLMQLTNDDEQLLEAKAKELGVSKADVMRMGLRQFCRTPEASAQPRRTRAKK